MQVPFIEGHVGHNEDSSIGPTAIMKSCKLVGQ